MVLVLASLDCHNFEDTEFVDSEWRLSALNVFLHGIYNKLRSVGTT